jgi:thioredoxin 1
MATIETNDQDFDRDVLEASKTKPVVVDWWAPWCGPCKMISEPLERLSETLSDKVSIVKCNIDENPQKPTVYGVRGIPLLLIFKDGEVIGQQVGAVSEDKLRQWIEDNLAE